MGHPGLPDLATVDGIPMKYTHNTFCMTSPITLHRHQQPYWRDPFQSQCNDVTPFFKSIASLSVSMRNMARLA
jgi:hypothetical protein